MLSAWWQKCPLLPVWCRRWWWWCYSVMMRPVRADDAVFCYSTIVDKWSTVNIHSLLPVVTIPECYSPSMVLMIWCLVDGEGNERSAYAFDILVNDLFLCYYDIRHWWWHSMLLHLLIFVSTLWSIVDDTFIHYIIDTRGNIVGIVVVVILFIVDDERSEEMTFVIVYIVILIDWYFIEKRNGIFIVGNYCLLFPFGSDILTVCYILTCVDWYLFWPIHYYIVMPVMAFRNVDGTIDDTCSEEIVVNDAGDDYIVVTIIHCLMLMQCHCRAFDPDDTVMMTFIIDGCCCCSILDDIVVIVLVDTLLMCCCAWKYWWCYTIVIMCTWKYWCWWWWEKWYRWCCSMMMSIMLLYSVMPFIARKYRYLYLLFNWWRVLVLCWERQYLLLIWWWRYGAILCCYSTVITWFWYSFGIWRLMKSGSEGMISGIDWTMRYCCSDIDDDLLLVIILWPTCIVVPDEVLTGIDDDEKCSLTC